jgi:hypothetical protein
MNGGSLMSDYRTTDQSLFIFLHAYVHEFLRMCGDIPSANMSTTHSYQNFLTTLYYLLYNIAVYGSTQMFGLLDA